MNKEDNNRIKELKRIIWLRNEIIKQAKKDIINAKKEKEFIENKYSYSRRRTK